jgi:hypothetical protein
MRNRIFNDFSNAELEGLAKYYFELSADVASPLIALRYRNCADALLEIIALRKCIADRSLAFDFAAVGSGIAMVQTAAESYAELARA